MTARACQVHFYRAANGDVPFAEWLRKLRDPIGRNRIRARLKLLEFGHLGDWKPIDDGMQEMRLHTGPGYRIYLGRPSQKRFVILWAGDKSTQSRDLIRALDYWADYKRRLL